VKVVPTAVAGCFEVALEPITDERGYFARAWSSDEMQVVDAADHIAQINMSASAKAGTVRGLHWRPMTHPEAKFVRCIRGRVFDVCVDLRADSPTYLQWTGVELTPDNRLALAVPAGCAHGYQTLEPSSEVLYAVSAPFVPGVEVGARWDDPTFGIDWPIQDGVVLSDKDRMWPDFDVEEGRDGR